MKLSTVHSLFITRDKMKHLGPNQNTVLNFWLFLDGLNEEQWDIICARYNEVSEQKEKQTSKVKNFLYTQNNELFSFLTSQQLWWKDTEEWRSYAGNCPCYATMEIVHSQQMIDTNLPFTYLPLFENV